MNDATDRAAQATDDAALRAIVQGVEAETGDRFFASLVRHLASALGVAYAFVTELSADRQQFRTLAVWGSVRGPRRRAERSGEAIASSLAARPA